MTDDVTLSGVSTIALILVLSFAIERVVSGIRFLFAWTGWLDPESVSNAEERRELERRSTALFFFLSVVASILAVRFFQLKGILQILGLRQADPYGLDFGLTVLVLAAGADRLGDVFTTYGGGKSESKSEAPLQVTGTLHLDEGTEARLSAHAAKPSLGR